MGVPSFADWMRTCLYDPTTGYYASGHVAFGAGGDFTTYPKRLSPAFGWAVLDLAWACLQPTMARIPDEAPLTFLEFGAGDATLARDVLQRIDQLGPPYTRIRYRIVEPSAGLRDRQRTELEPWLEAGRAEIVDGSITEYRDDSFVGFAFANEVLDALCCEQIHVADDGLYRTHVLVKPPGADAEVTELHVGLDEGWATQQTVGSVPVQLARHLALLEPLIDDLRDARLTPSDYYWSSDVAPAVDTLTSLVRRGTGVAMVVDYGGTSRHVLDRTMRPHLRVYSGHRRTLNPYERPGEVDLTWDVDFTELGQRASSGGVAVHYAHPAILATNARGETAELVERLAYARGFRTMVFHPSDATIPALGPSDAWIGRGLATIRGDATPDLLRAALAEADAEELAPMFGRCCDIVGTLVDLRRYAARWDVFEALERHGLVEW